MIPQQIIFMNQIWRIRPAKFKELEGDTLGQCDPTTNEIVLDPTLTNDVLLQTLFHELTHVIEMTLHQHLTESQTDVIATGMIHLLKSNPALVNLLMASIPETEDDNDGKEST